MMASSLKKDSSLREEFEVPDNLGGIVETIKKEQQSIQKKIDEAKSQAMSKKEDESTKIFNLRQHQMQAKISELEEKKKQSEKELQLILQQKNSTLHADLKKLIQLILLEARKIVPQINQVDQKISSISSLKKELDYLFESQISDRKKAFEVLEDQNVLIHHIEEQARDTLKLLQTDFHLLSKEMEKILIEKHNETKKLQIIKQEILRDENVYEQIDLKKRQLRELENQVSLFEFKASQSNQLGQELEALKAEVEKFRLERDQLESVAHQLKQDLVVSQEEGERLKTREKYLINSISVKKHKLELMDEELNDTRRTLELRKKEEHDAQIKILDYQDHFFQLKTEIGKLDGAKEALALLLKESDNAFEEKKNFINREIDLMKQMHEAKTLELKASLEEKVMKWDLDYQNYVSIQKLELDNELKKIKKDDLEEVRKNKKQFFQDVLSLVETVTSSECKMPPAEKSSVVKKELYKKFDALFGKTQRWKFW
jgi:hypothetical protein